MGWVKNILQMARYSEVNWFKQTQQTCVQFLKKNNRFYIMKNGGVGHIETSD